MPLRIDSAVTEETSGRTVAPCLQWALAALVAISAVDVQTLGLPLQVRPGFVVAGIGIAILGVVVVTRQRAAVARVVRTHRVLALALGGVLASRAASALLNGLASGAVAEVARAAAVVVAILLALALTDEGGGLRHRLGVASAAVLGANAALLAVGAAFPSAAARVFESVAEHQLVGSLPRFRGGCNTAGTCGFQLLLATLLVRGITPPTWRRVATLLGILMVASTFSFATLCLPLVAGAVLLRRRATRWGAQALVLGAALLALWSYPLELRIAGWTALARSPAADWSRDGLGPRFMPVHRIAIGDTVIAFRATGYFALTKRGVTCMAEHPLAGVGGRGFERECPVMTMGTVGAWTDRRPAHSEYAGQLAEYGLLGVVATLGVVWAMTTRYRYCVDDPWARGLFVTCLAAAFAGAIWYQLPIAAFVGAWLCRQRAIATREPAQTD